MTAPAPAAARIDSDDLAERLAGVLPIGRAADGATTRLPWTAEDDASGAWFAEQAAACGLRVERDAAGNRWALPDTPAPWWVVGSHLDSVRGGGAYDGALGVVAAFAVAARAAAPVAVVSFADEEGARFNLPTFGSRALVGALDLPSVLPRPDRDGVALADALRAAGVDPAGVVDAPRRLAQVRGFFELHIDQGTQAAERGVPFTIAAGLAARSRTRVVFSGTADHAGTAAPEGRHDALAAAAATIVAVEQLPAQLPGVRGTVGRIEVAPGAATTIAGAATIWVDVRGADDPARDAGLGRLEAAARAAAEQRGVGIELERESLSPAVAFDARMRAALGAPHVPETTCWAGHDAGILAPHRPAAMVLVRNASGISHAPEEHVELTDAAAAASAILEAVDAV